MSGPVDSLPEVPYYPPSIADATAAYRHLEAAFGPIGTRALLSSFEKVLAARAERDASPDPLGVASEPVEYAERLLGRDLARELSMMADNLRNAV